MSLKQIITISILSFYLQNIQGQMRHRLNGNDLEYHKLNGKVHKMEYREYEPSQINDTNFTYNLIFEPFINNHFDFIYNKNGFLTTKNEYDQNKGMLEKAAEWSYIYDKKNIIIKEQKISYKYRDTTAWNYSYPNRDTVIIEKKDRILGTIYYRYVQEGEKEKLDTRRKETPFKIQSFFYYDKKNRIYKTQTYSKDTIYSTRNYEYSDLKSKNITIEKNFYKGKLFLFESKKYDKENNVVTIYNLDKKIIESFEYIYDKKKNWIEKKTFNKMGVFVKLTKRKITYY